MIESQWFGMSTTPFSLVFGIVLVAATIVFSFIALQRTGFRSRTVALEVIRVLLAIVVAFTLNQPEWLQEFKPKESPVLAVLWDESESMTTADVIDGKNPSGKPIERQQWIKPMLSEEIWAPLSESVDIVKQPFSSAAEKSNGATDINQALNDALAQHKNLRGVVLFSDGGWNIGLPPSEASTQMRIKKVPVFTVAVGSDDALPDVEVTSLDAPTFGVVDKAIRIPFSVRSTMPKAVNVVASLTSSDGVDISKPIEIPANGSFEDVFVWKPKKVGEYTLALSIPESVGEISGKNNTMTVPVSIRKEQLKVLLVESFPRWEYRYLRNALVRDPGVEVSCLLFHPNLTKVGGGRDYIDEFPSSVEALSEYDVIFLGDVGVAEGQLSESDCENIKRVVESQASGLILMPGFRGEQISLAYTELSPLLPVVMDQSQPTGWGSQTPSQFELTLIGRESLLTKLADSPEANASVWRSLPGFQWFAAVERVKAGTQVLAVHGSETNGSGRVPLIATKTYGTGKVLYMGTDSAWRWREGVEDKYHYRFWGQVARWMAYQRKMSGGESMRLFYSPERPKVGQVVSLNANVMSLAGEPLQSGEVNVQIINPSDQSELIKMLPPNSDSSWGLFTNTFTPQESGDHRVVMTCRQTGATLETVINVQGGRREKIGQPVNRNVLKEIASITRGKMVTTENIGDVFDAIEKLPEPEPKLRRIRIWANPIWGACLIGLMGMFWIGRKFNGTI